MNKPLRSAACFLRRLFRPVPSWAREPDAVTELIEEHLQLRHAVDCLLTALDNRSRERLAGPVFRLREAMASPPAGSLVGSGPSPDTPASVAMLEVAKLRRLLGDAGRALDKLSDRELVSGAGDPDLETLPDADALEEMEIIASAAARPIRRYFDCLTGRWR